MLQQIIDLGAEPDDGTGDNAYAGGLKINANFTEIFSKIRTGTGSPQGNLEAPVGTLYLRSDGGANTTLYIKESGTGVTGWVAK